jgi:chemotaxis protein MotB
VRKKKPPEHANHERWLVSYADFITLLFAFFTTMYAISNIDAQKMGRMVLSMRASFNSPVFPTGSDNLSLSSGTGAGSALSKDLVENVAVPKEKAIAEYSIQNLKDLKTNFVRDALPQGEVIALGKIRENVEAIVKARAMTNKVRTRVDTRGLVISLGDGSCFDSGSDQLRSDGRQLMDALAQQLVAVDNDIKIEGHTDDVPIRNLRFANNWELSTARATTVISYLIQHFGFKDEKLSASGYAETRPIADNKTAEGRARNRRIDIVILNSIFSRGEPR